MTGRKFAHQMLPFVLYLASGDRNGWMWQGHRDFGWVERVTTSGRFGVHGTQIRPDRGQRRRLCAETRQLRMGLVSARLALDHSLGKQRLAPERDQTLRV